MDILWGKGECFGQGKREGELFNNLLPFLIVLLDRFFHSHLALSPSLCLHHSPKSGISMAYLTTMDGWVDRVILGAI